MALSSFTEYQAVRTTAEALINETLTAEQLLHELRSGLSNLFRTGMAAVGQGAKSAWNATTAAAQKGLDASKQAAAGVAATYHQGEDLGKVDNALNSVKNLQQQLPQMGLRSPEIVNFMRRLEITLQNARNRMAGDKNLRFGQPGVWKSAPQQPNP